MDEKSYESVSDSSSSDLYEDLKVIKYENFQLVPKQRKSTKINIFLEI